MSLLYVCTVRVQEDATCQYIHNTQTPYYALEKFVTYNTSLKVKSKLLNLDLKQLNDFLSTRNRIDVFCGQGTKEEKLEIIQEAVNIITNRFKQWTISNDT